LKGENSQVYDMEQTHDFHSQLMSKSNQIKQDQNGKNTQYTMGFNLKGENSQVYDMEQTHDFHSQLMSKSNQIKQDQNGKNTQYTMGSNKIITRARTKKYKYQPALFVQT